MNNVYRMKTLTYSSLAVFAVLAISIFSSHQSVADDKPKELTTFLEIHNKYCESDITSKEELLEVLKNADDFKPAPSFAGVYETMINNVSYAVSPEVDGCTTDIMVKNTKTNKLMFTYSEISNALVAAGYKISGAETSRKDVGNDKKEITILERSFTSPTGVITNLDYPADRPDQYYMTLFAKKFDTKEATNE